MTDLQKELTLTREFTAPVNMVFKAWTDQELVKQWWGPNGVTNPICEVNPIVGGTMHIVMLAGEELGPLKGQEWPMTGTFNEIEENKKIVFTGNAIVNNKPVLETLTTVTFEEANGKTKITVHIVVTKTTPEAAGPMSGMEMGWNQQLDKFVNFITKQ